MTPFTLFQRHYQLGYVVRDIEAAKAVMASRYGIARWEMTGNVTMAEHIAKAYAGDIMIELLQPWSDRQSIYDGYLPDAVDDMRLHHMGYFAESMEEFQAALTLFEGMGAAIPAQGGRPDVLEYFYADTRSSLGHYCEFLCLLDAGKGFYAGVPRNGVSQRTAAAPPAAQLFQRHFQSSYVVRDVMAVIELWRERYGLTQWHMLEGSTLAGRIALAYAGDVMIELIEPRSGGPAVYATHLPDDRTGARFHHFGYLFDTLDDYRAARAAVRDAGIACPLEGGREGMVDYCYADMTASLGHYCELVHVPRGSPLFAHVPRN